MAGEGKPINVLNALVSLGVDPDSAARVQREITKQAGAIQSRLDKLNSTKAQKSMDLWAAAVKEAGGAEKLTADQTKILVNEMERLQKSGAKVSVALQPAIDSVNKLRAAEKAAADQAAKTADAQAKSAADTAQLKSGILDKAGLGALAGAGPAAAALLGVGAMAGVAKETFDLINSTAELADEVSNLATKYQISTDSVQQFQFMADRTGISMESFGDAIVNITKNLDEAPDKFKKWGMDVEHLRSLKPDELLGAMSEKLKSLNESDRLTFAKELMKGVDLLPALLGGFDELAQKAAELGINLSSADIESLKGLRDSIDDIGTAWDGMWVQLGAAIAQDQDVQDFFTAFKDGIVELARLIKENKHEIVNFAKMLAGMATFNVSLAGKGALGLVSGPGPTTYEWGTDPTIDPKKPRTSRPDPAATRERDALRQEVLRNEYDRYKAETKRLDDEAEAAKKAAELALKHKLWMAKELISLTNETTKLLTLGASQAARNQALNAPPGTLNAAALRALGVDVLNTKTGVGGKPIQYNLGAPPKLEEGEKVKESWSEFLQITANMFQSMGKSGAALAKVVGGIGGIGAMFEKNADGKNAFSGGLNLKSITAGLSAAFAAFDIGKTLFNLFHKTEAQKVAFDVGRDYGVKISEGLSQEIAKNSKTMGREAAGLLSLDKIIGEAGGVQAFGVDKTIGKMRDLFSMIQTGKMTTEQAKGPFDKLFGEVAQASISKTTGLVSLQVKELMALNAASGMGSEAVEKFRNEQRAIADTILTRLANNKGFNIANGQAGEALGAALAAQYKRYVEQGLSGLEIAEKLGPQIDALQKKFDEAGTGGGEAFDAMVAKVELFRSEVTGPTAQAMQDIIALSAALYNSGDLTRDQFQGLANQVGSDFEALKVKMAEAGQDPSKAFDMMAGDLQKLWEMQRLYNVELDATTQKMLDDAEAAGKVGEERMSAEDRMAEGIEYLGEVMKRVGESLGATFDDLPGRAKKAADGIGTALDGITPPDLSPTGKLDLPTDMSPYEAGSGVNSGRLSEAIAELAQSADGSAVGDALNPGLGDMGAAIGEGLGALAHGSQTITTNVTLQDGTIVGSITKAVDRNSPEGSALITALAEKLKGRG